MSGLTITPLEEQQMFDDWCPYKGNPDPRVVWAAAIEAVNGMLLLGARNVSDRFDIVLDPFTALMRRELHANTHKGDREAWVNLTRDGSMFEVYDHASKLGAALRVSDEAKILEHAADVANAAMMVLDARGVLVDPKGHAQ